MKGNVANLKLLESFRNLQLIYNQYNQFNTVFVKSEFLLEKRFKVGHNQIFNQQSYSESLNVSEADEQIGLKIEWKNCNVWSHSKFRKIS